MQRADRFSSQMGSLEEGSWEAFLTCRSQSNFSGPPYNPLQAVYSFEPNGFIPKGIRRGIPLGRIFAQSLQKQNFLNLHIIHVKPITVLNKTVSSQKGVLRGIPLGRNFDLSLQKHFSGPPYDPLQADYKIEQNGFIPKGILRGTPLGRILSLSFHNLFFRIPI